MPQVNTDTREKIALTVHAVWSHWMEYLFSVSERRDDGSIRIPSELVTRWAERMKTDYFWLSEDEKESDRRQADKIIAALKGSDACQ